MAAFEGGIDFRVEGHLSADHDDSHGQKVLVIGQTFKPGVADMRNSKAIALVDELKVRSMHVQIFEPFFPGNNDQGVMANLSADSLEDVIGKYDVVVVAVPHSPVIERSDLVIELIRRGGLLVDVSGAISESMVVMADRVYWKL